MTTQPEMTIVRLRIGRLEVLAALYQGGGILISPQRPRREIDSYLAAVFPQARRIALQKAMKAATEPLVPGAVAKAAYVTPLELSTC